MAAPALRRLSCSWGVASLWVVRRFSWLGPYRYIVKLSALFLVCIILGASMPRLYGSTSTVHSHPGANAGYLSPWNTSLSENMSQESNSESRPLQDALFKVKDSFREKSSALKNWFSAAGDLEEPTLWPFEEETQPAYSHGERPFAGKITILTSDQGDNIYERALRTHVAHNKRHNYPMFTLRQNLMPAKDSVWSKPAYILSVILRELAKPPADRLEWLLWVDADTVLLNPHVPIEIFLPPAGWDDVNLLVTKDFNGVNNGIFPIRVCAWSVDLLTAILSYPAFFPGRRLEFRDQSAMEILLEDPKFAKHTLFPPQRWFNAYPGEHNDTLAAYQVRRGDMLVHFAGFGDREERMAYWIDRAEKHEPDWELEMKLTNYPNEVRDYWVDAGRNRIEQLTLQEQLVVQRTKEVEDIAEWKDEFGGSLDDIRLKQIEVLCEQVTRMMDDPNTKEDDRAIEDALYSLRMAAEPVMDMAMKADKMLLTEAHNAVIALEADEVINAKPPEEAESEYKEFRKSLQELKRLLMADRMNPKRLQEALNELNTKTETLIFKKNELENKDKEGKPKKPEKPGMTSDDADGQTAGEKDASIALDDDEAYRVTFEEEVEEDINEPLELEDRSTSALVSAT